MTCNCAWKCNCPNYIVDLSNNVHITMEDGTRAVGFAPFLKNQNIVANGFGIKEVVAEAITKHHSADTGIYYYEQRMPDDYIERLSNEIQEALAVKLGLIQGDKND